MPNIYNIGNIEILLEKLIKDKYQILLAKKLIDLFKLLPDNLGKIFELNNKSIPFKISESINEDDLDRLKKSLRHRNVQNIFDKDNRIFYIDLNALLRVHVMHFINLTSPERLFSNFYTSQSTDNIIIFHDSHASMHTYNSFICGFFYSNNSEENEHFSCYHLIAQVLIISAFLIALKKHIERISSYYNESTIITISSTTLGTDISLAAFNTFLIYLKQNKIEPISNTSHSFKIKLGSLMNLCTQPTNLFNLNFPTINSTDFGYFLGEILKEFSEQLKTTIQAPLKSAKEFLVNSLIMKINDNKINDVSSNIISRYLTINFSTNDQIHKHLPLLIEWLKNNEIKCDHTNIPFFREIKIEFESLNEYKGNDPDLIKLKDKTKIYHHHTSLRPAPKPPHQPQGFNYQL